MSTITIDAVPDELTALIATPEGMARARAAVLGAFPETDTRTASEKTVDAWWAYQKARERAKRERLIASALEAEALHKPQGEATKLQQEQAA